MCAKLKTFTAFYSRYGDLWGSFIAVSLVVPLNLQTSAWSGSLHGGTGATPKNIAAGEEKTTTVKDTFFAAAEIGVENKFDSAFGEADWFWCWRLVSGWLRPPVDSKTLAPTGLRSFVVHEEPRMVAVPQFLSPEEWIPQGLGGWGHGISALSRMSRHSRNKALLRPY